MLELVSVKITWFIVLTSVLPLSKWVSISSKGSCSTVNRCKTLDMSSGTGARMMMGSPIEIYDLRQGKG